MLPPAPHTELPCLSVTPVACPGLGESCPQLLSWLRPKDGSLPILLNGAASLAVPADDLAVQRCLLTVQSRMSTGWPGCQVLPRRGWAGVLAWLADVGKQAGMHLLSPPRARQVQLGSHASAHLGCCFLCSANLLPHHWLPSAPWPRERCHVVMGCSLWPTVTWACVWLWDNAGITERWQRPFCPLHWNLQGESVPSQGGGSCPLYTWCFHVSLVPWHC